jgi:hypothetical protein
MPLELIEGSSEKVKTDEKYKEQIQGNSNLRKHLVTGRKDKL